MNTKTATVQKDIYEASQVIEKAINNVLPPVRHTLIKVLRGFCEGLPLQEVAAATEIEPRVAQNLMYNHRLVDKSGHLSPEMQFVVNVMLYREGERYYFITPNDVESVGSFGPIVIPPVPRINRRDNPICLGDERYQRLGGLPVGARFESSV